MFSIKISHVLLNETKNKIFIYNNNDRSNTSPSICSILVYPYRMMYLNVSSRHFVQDSIKKHKCQEDNGPQLLGIINYYASLPILQKTFEKNHTYIQNLNMYVSLLIVKIYFRLLYKIKKHHVNKL